MLIFKLPKKVVANVRRNGSDYPCTHGVVLPADDEFAYSATSLAEDGYCWSQSTWGKSAEAPEGHFIRTYPSPHLEWAAPTQEGDVDEATEVTRKRVPKVARHPKYGYLLVAKLVISTTPPRAQLEAGADAPWLKAALKKAISADPQDFVLEDVR